MAFNKAIWLESMCVYILNGFVISLSFNITHYVLFKRVAVIEIFVFLYFSVNCHWVEIVYSGLENISYVICKHRG